MFLYRALCAGILFCTAIPAYADHPSLGFGTSGAGPIIAQTAATLPQGKLALGLSSEYIRSERFSDAELTAFATNHVHAHSVDWILNTALGISYGVAGDLTLNLRIPHIYRDNVRSASHVHGGGGVVVNSAADHGDSGGIGDMALLGKYRFWDEASQQAAMLFGVKVPTGRTNVAHDGESLEAEHQPGSGAWDGLFGFAAGSRIGPVSLDASALYSLTGEGVQDTNLGDRLSYNLALSTRIGGGEHDHGDLVHHHQAWDLVLELNGEWSDKKKVSGEEDKESGGNVVFLSPGLRYAPDENWSTHFSVGIPVVSNQGDGHTEVDYKLTFGILRGF